MTTELAHRTFRNLFNNMVPKIEWDDLFYPDDLFYTAIDQAFHVDIKEKPTCVELTAEIPGVPKENIDISIDNGTLTIRASKVEEKANEDERYVRRERKYGAITRSFKLVDGLDPDSVSASLNNGILKVTVNKHQKNQLKKVTIQ